MQGGEISGTLQCDLSVGHNIAAIDEIIDSMCVPTRRIVLVTSNTA